MLSCTQSTHGTPQKVNVFYDSFLIKQSYLSQGQKQNYKEITAKGAFWSKLLKS
jgi:hypothetical protein